MKFLVLAVAVLCLARASLGKSDAKAEAAPGDKHPEKRGVVEVQPSSSAYVTAAPALAAGVYQPYQLSHGPALVQSVSSAPGIIYAQQKQVVAAASPSQLYAKPSPHLAKISDAVLAGHASPAYSGLVTNQLYQQQAYQPLTKVGYATPAYAVSAPIPSHLAYSKHQIFPQQAYAHQPQIQVQQPVHYAAYSQPQLNYVQQPQHLAQQQYLQHANQVAYVQHAQAYPQPQVSYSHPQAYAHPQAAYSQHQAAYSHQPQIYQQVAYQQPQVVHQQYAQAVVAQPSVAKVAYAQPIAQQVYAAQPVVAKEGAISYASFSQGHGGNLQYSAPVEKIAYAAPQAALVAKQVYQHPQQLVHQAQLAPAHGQIIYQPQHQQQQIAYAHTSPAAAYAKTAYHQPQVQYATQYFGKFAAGNPIAYSGYHH